MEDYNLQIILLRMFEIWRGLFKTWIKVRISYKYYWYFKNNLGFNATEWVITFFGSLFAGLMPVGVYTTNNP